MSRPRNVYSVRKPNKDSASYSIYFRDHLGIERRVLGSKNKDVAEYIGESITEMVRLRATNRPLTPALLDFMKSKPAKLKKKLRQWGIVTTTKKENKMNCNRCGTAETLTWHHFDIDEKTWALCNDCYGIIVQGIGENILKKMEQVQEEENKRRKDTDKSLDNWNEKRKKEGKETFLFYKLGMMAKAGDNIYPGTPAQKDQMAELAEKGYLEPNTPKYPARYRLTKKGRELFDELDEYNRDILDYIFRLWCR